MVARGETALLPEIVEKLKQSLAVNPSWGAAADYAGVSDRTVRGWRQRAEQFAKKIEGDESLADLTGRRLYRDARDAWERGEWSRSQRLLRALENRLERDPDKPYYDAVSEMIETRARGELGVIARIRAIATTDGHRDQLKALLSLLRIYGRPEYSERIAVTGADGGELEIALSDAEARARAALEGLRAKREREESG